METQKEMCISLLSDALESNVIQKKINIYYNNEYNRREVKNMAYYEDGFSWDIEEMFPRERDREIDYLLMSSQAHIEYLIDKCTLSAPQDEMLNEINYLKKIVDQTRELFNQEHNESFVLERTIQEREKEDEDE